MTARHAAALAALVCVAALLVGAALALDAPEASPEVVAPRRAIPEYDGRAPATPRADAPVRVWARAIAGPARFTLDHIVRPTLRWVIVRVEHSALVE